MWNFIKELKRKDHLRYLGGLDFFKYIGPGLLVTVGFIDPGNWASNFAAGSDYGYALLWIVTLSTVMLIILQHNVAHLGIVTGLCLSEAATKYTPKWVSRPILGTDVLVFAPGFGYGCFSLYIYLVGRNIRRCHCFTDAFRYSCCLWSSAYNSFGCHNAFYKFL